MCPMYPESSPDDFRDDNEIIKKNIGFTMYLVVGGVKGGLEDCEGRPNHQIPAGSIQCHSGGPKYNLWCKNDVFRLFYNGFSSAQ